LFFPKIKRASKVKRFQKVTAFFHAQELNTTVKELLEQEVWSQGSAGAVRWRLLYRKLI